MRPLADAGLIEEVSEQQVYSEADGRFQQTPLLPPLTLEASDTVGAPQADLRVADQVHIAVAEDGRYGMFATDGGGGDVAMRVIDVYDLSGPPKHRCRSTVTVPEGGSPPRFPEVRGDSCTP